MIIDGFGAADTMTQKKGGIAIAVSGDRIHIVNSTVINPFPENGAGIRMFGGTGFRCRGGSVDSGGEAALQFSTGRFGGVPSIAITDGAISCTRCSSQDGRMMLVGTSDTAIRDVRFIGISGSTNGDGECIRVQNIADNGGAGGAIADVAFRDVAVSHGSVAARAVSIRNDFDDPAKRIARLRFENFTIGTPSDIAFAVYSDTIVAVTSSGPIQDISWRGGGIVDPRGQVAPAISIERLTGGIFEGLRLSAGNAQPAVVLGDTIAPIGNPDCRNVVFEDVAIADVRNGKIGAVVDKASSCTWVRGMISQKSPEQATAFVLTGNARNVSVAGADLSGIATAFVVDPAATYRLGHNYGDTRRTAIGFGAATSLPVSGMATNAPLSSYAALTGGATAVKSVVGGRPGDLIVMGTASTSPPVTVKDNAAGGNLQLDGDFLPDSTQDAILLMNTGDAKWAELSRSGNA